MAPETTPKPWVWFPGNNNNKISLFGLSSAKWIKWILSV